MGDANQSTTEKALRDAEKTIAKVESHNLSEASPFQELRENILEIAQALALLNKARIGDRAGEEIQELNDSDRDRLVRVINGGIDIATMLLARINEDDRAANPPPRYNEVFLSKPGEEDNYVKRLYDSLKDEAPSMPIFLDNKELLGSPHPPNEMFRQVLKANLVVSICTYHSVQKKWPVAELLCALARNRAAAENNNKTGERPLLVDAMPGMTWLQSPAGKARNTKCWLDDLCALFPVTLPGMKALEASTSIDKHLHQVSEHVLSHFSVEASEAATIQEFFRNMYRNYTLGLFLVEGEESRDFRSHYVHLRVDGERKKIDPLGLFPEENQRNLVYIEGPAGAGKSTLCRYLCHAWASNEALQSFQLVVRTDLRDLNGLADWSRDSVVERILANAGASRDQQSRFKKGLSSLRILWIFDALDEAEANADDGFIRMLQTLCSGQEIPWIRDVLLTSRPEKRTIVRFTKFPLQEFKEQDALEFVRSYCHRLHLEGITRQEMERVVREDRNGLFRTPLLVQFAGLWVLSHQGASNEGSLLDMYEAVLCDFVPRYQLKKIDADEVDYDVFKSFWLLWLEDLARHPKEFSHTQLFEFWKNVKGEVSVKDVEKFKDIKKLGLIKRSRNYLPESYEFIHPSFRDFFHARWWKKQSEAAVVRCFQGPEISERAGFYSALSFQFFCDMLEQSDRKKLLAVAASLVRHRYGRVAQWVGWWPNVARRMVGGGSFRDDNRDSLCFTLVELDLASLLSAACDVLGKRAGPFVSKKTTMWHWIVGPDLDISLLQEALWCDHASCVKVLLEHGAEPYVEDFDGMCSALVWAARYGQKACVRVLVNQGSTKEELGEAFREAAIPRRAYYDPFPRPNLDMMKLLVLECGATVNHLEKGKTVLDSLVELRDYFSTTTDNHPPHRYAELVDRCDEAIAFVRKHNGLQTVSSKFD